MLSGFKGETCDVLALLPLRFEIADEEQHLVCSFCRRDSLFDGSRRPPTVFFAHKRCFCTSSLCPVAELVPNGREAICPHVLGVRVPRQANIVRIVVSNCPC